MTNPRIQSSAGNLTDGVSVASGAAGPMPGRIHPVMSNHHCDAAKVPDAAALVGQAVAIELGILIGITAVTIPNALALTIDVF
jgi:hypothetical protein